MKKQKICGESAFQQYYSEIFDNRWQSLKEALLLPSEPIKLQISETKQPYFMDKASIMAASSLPLDNCQNVLDMCAAPGGKTLVLASLMPNDCTLLCNDRSSDRINRLKKVVSDCLPENISHRINVTCKDGGSLCRFNPDFFDAILLDAPCSSERHVLTSPEHLNIWSPNRVKTLAMGQWALLSAAFRMVKPNGYVLYATCALSSAENDEIVAKLEKKFDNVEFIRDFTFNKKICNYIEETQFPLPEKTKYGYHVLPDSANGAGPLYFCLIKKV